MRTVEGLPVQWSIGPGGQEGDWIKAPSPSIYWGLCKADRGHWTHTGEDWGRRDTGGLWEDTGEDTGEDNGEDTG